MASPDTTAAGAASSPGINKPARARRAAPRNAASIYQGRDLVGRVEPAGSGYRAFDAEGKRLGSFDTFDAAAGAVTALARGAA